MASIEDVIVERMRPAAIRTDDGLQWQFDSKAELHPFITRLNDLIINDLKYRDVRYEGSDTVFRPAKGAASKIVLMITNITVTLVVSE
jgi:hypothetical protein